MTVMLTYSQGLNVTTGTGTTYFVLNGNNVQSPNPAIGAHQPYYFDQYAALYDKYMVYSSSLKVSLLNTSAGAQILGIWPSTTSTGGAANAGELLEQPYVRTRTVPFGAGALPVTVSASMSTAKMRGGTLMSEEWGGLVSGNPERAWFWNVNVITFGGSNSDHSMTFTMRFKVRFYKRSQVDQS